MSRGPVRRWQNPWNVKPPLLDFFLAALMDLSLCMPAHSTRCTSSGTTGIYCCAEEAHCTSSPEREHCPDHFNSSALGSCRLRNGPGFPFCHHSDSWQLRRGKELGGCISLGFSKEAEPIGHRVGMCTPTHTDIKDWALT